MTTEPQRHITLGSPLSNETTPTRLGLPYASDRSVQKRKLACRTLYKLSNTFNTFIYSIYTVVTPPLHLGVSHRFIGQWIVVQSMQVFSVISLCYVVHSCLPYKLAGQMYISSSSHIATDSQPASLSWCLAPLGAGDQMLHFFEWQLLSWFLM
jgi:hypothetical protein